MSRLSRLIRQQIVGGCGDSVTTSSPSAFNGANNEPKWAPILLFGLLQESQLLLLLLFVLLLFLLLLLLPPLAPSARPREGEFVEQAQEQQSLLLLQ